MATTSVVCRLMVVALLGSPALAAPAEPANDPGETGTTVGDPAPAPGDDAGADAAPPDQSTAEPNDTDTLDPVARYWVPLMKKTQEYGVKLETHYTADFLTNARGGLRTGFQYKGLLDVGLTLETKPLGLWDGGKFYIDFVTSHGVNMTERYVGDLQYTNNIDGPNQSRAYEFWYQQGLFDDRVSFKLGKIDVNTDFAAGLYRSEFIHSAAAFSPTIPMVSFPNTALGAELLLDPFKWCYLHAGVYDADGKSARTGFDTAFQSPDNTFTIFETGLKPNLTLFGEPNLPGQYSVGGFYRSDIWPIFFNDLGGRLRPRCETGNSGLYVACDQLVFREPGTSEDQLQGLALFFQFGWSPADRNEMSQHFGGGLQYCGLIPTRDDDIVGVGLQHITLSDRVQTLEHRYAETAVEFFYKIKITDWLSAKPDFQYIATPGGNGRDALIAGVRLEFSL